MLIWHIYDSQKLREAWSLFVHLCTAACTVLQSPSGQGFTISPLVTGVNVEAATSNSICLLAVCSVPGPASGSLTGLFCLTPGSPTVHTLRQTSFSVASKPHPLWLATQDSPSHRKSTLWANGMRITWKGPLYPIRGHYWPRCDLHEENRLLALSFVYPYKRESHHLFLKTTQARLFF